MMKQYLILEDGSIYAGDGFASQQDMVGEVVFTTGMTGYQEAITDQSYANQILVFTNPLIGNYGISNEGNESLTPHIRGVICHQVARVPANWQLTTSLPSFLTHHHIPAIQGIDTRELVLKLRQHGTMKGKITTDPHQLKKTVSQLKAANPTHQVIAAVTTQQPYRSPASGRDVVVIDFGLKSSILYELNKRHCSTTVLPASASAQDVLDLNPDGVLLSNGPGDPTEMTAAAKMVAIVEQHVPVFGICMGHQVFALANGAHTYKLKFGHRGFNHPVKDLATGKVAFTSQNHGYAVAKDSLADTDLAVTHVEINDGTVEGLRHRTYPAFSVQFHPDAAPGPHDFSPLFDHFMQLIDHHKEVVTNAQEN